MRIVTSLLILFIFTTNTIGQNMENTESLKSELEAYKQKFLQKADEKKIKVYEEGIKDIIQKGILEKATKKGENAPNFTLKNALGKEVQLSDYLQKGKVILTWYRGGWCPYCNLTLRHLQEFLPQFKAEGASLLALTPELPDNSLKTSEKHNLEFEVLTDLDNKVAEEYGIVFKLTPEVAEYYKNAFDLEIYNGNDSNELPLAVTYVIDQNGMIAYTFIDADYRNRAEPQAILDFLKGAK